MPANSCKHRFYFYNLLPKILFPESLPEGKDFFYPKLSYIILLQFICSLMISQLHDSVLYSRDRNVPSYAFWHYFGVPLTPIFCLKIYFISRLPAVSLPKNS